MVLPRYAGVDELNNFMMVCSFISWLRGRGEAKGREESLPITFLLLADCRERRAEKRRSKIKDGSAAF